MLKARALSNDTYKTSGVVLNQYNSGMNKPNHLNELITETDINLQDIENKYIGYNDSDLYNNLNNQININNVLSFQNDDPRKLIQQNQETQKFDNNLELKYNNSITKETNDNVSSRRNNLNSRNSYYENQYQTQSPDNKLIKHFKTIEFSDFTERNSSNNNFFNIAKNYMQNMDNNNIGMLDSPQRGNSTNEKDKYYDKGQKSTLREIEGNSQCIKKNDQKLNTDTKNPNSDQINNVHIHTFNTATKLNEDQNIPDNYCNSIIFSPVIQNPPLYPNHFENMNQKVFQNNNFPEKNYHIPMTAENMNRKIDNRYTVDEKIKECNISNDKNQFMDVKKSYLSDNILFNKSHANINNNPKMNYLNSSNNENFQPSNTSNITYLNNQIEVNNFNVHGGVSKETAFNNFTNINLNSPNRSTNFNIFNTEQTSNVLINYFLHALEIERLIHMNRDLLKESKDMEIEMCDTEKRLQDSHQENELLKSKCTNQDKIINELTEKLKRQESSQIQNEHLSPYKFLTLPESIVENEIKNKQSEAYFTSMGNNSEVVNHDTLTNIKEFTSALLQKEKELIALAKIKPIEIKSQLEETTLPNFSLLNSELILSTNPNFIEKYKKSGSENIYQSRPNLLAKVSLDTDISPLGTNKNEFESWLKMQEEKMMNELDNDVLKNYSKGFDDMTCIIANNLSAEQETQMNEYRENSNQLTQNDNIVRDRTEHNSNYHLNTSGSLNIYNFPNNERINTNLFSMYDDKTITEAKTELENELNKMSQDSIDLKNNLSKKSLSPFKHEFEDSANKNTRNMSFPFRDEMDNNLIHIDSVKKIYGLFPIETARVNSVNEIPINLTSKKQSLSSRQDISSMKKVSFEDLSLNNKDFSKRKITFDEAVIKESDIHNKIQQEINEMMNSSKDILKTDTQINISKNSINKIESIKKNDSPEQSSYTTFNKITKENENSHFEKPYDIVKYKEQSNLDSGLHKTVNKVRVANTSKEKSPGGTNSQMQQQAKAMYKAGQLKNIIPQDYNKNTPYLEAAKQHSSNMIQNPGIKSQNDLKIDKTTLSKMLEKKSPQSHNFSQNENKAEYSKPKIQNKLLSTDNFERDYKVKDNNTSSHSLTNIVIKNIASPETYKISINNRSDSNIKTKIVYETPMNDSFLKTKISESQNSIKKNVQQNMHTPSKHQDEQYSVRYLDKKNESRKQLYVKSPKKQVQHQKYQGDVNEELKKRIPANLINNDKIRYTPIGKQKDVSMYEFTNRSNKDLTNRSNKDLEKEINLSSGNKQIFLPKKKYSNASLKKYDQITKKTNPIPSDRYSNPIPSDRYSNPIPSARYSNNNKNHQGSHQEIYFNSPRKTAGFANIDECISELNIKNKKNLHITHQSDYNNILMAKVKRMTKTPKSNYNKNEENSPQHFRINNEILQNSRSPQNIKTENSLEDINATNRSISQSNRLVKNYVPENFYHKASVKKFEPIHSQSNNANSIINNDNHNQDQSNSRKKFNSKLSKLVYNEIPNVSTKGNDNYVTDSLNSTKYYEKQKSKNNNSTFVTYRPASINTNANLSLDKKESLYIGSNTTSNNHQRNNTLNFIQVLDEKPYYLGNNYNLVNKAQNYSNPNFYYNNDESLINEDPKKQSKKDDFISKKYNNMTIKNDQSLNIGFSQRTITTPKESNFNENSFINKPSEKLSKTTNLVGIANDQNTKTQANKNFQNPLMNQKGKRSTIFENSIKNLTTNHLYGGTPERFEKKPESINFFAVNSSNLHRPSPFTEPNTAKKNTEAVKAIHQSRIH